MVTVLILPSLKITNIIIRDITVRHRRIIVRKEKKNSYKKRSFNMS